MYTRMPTFEQPTWGSFYPRTVQNSEHSSVYKPSFAEVIAKIDSLIGLTEIKAKLYDFFSYMVVAELRRKSGFNNFHPSYSAINVGLPGTGKSVVSRLFCEALCAMEHSLFRTFKEVSAVELIADYNGQSGHQTAEVIEEIKPGILLIDEIQAFFSSGGYGSESLSVLVKEMEDRKESFAVVFNGTPQEIAQLLKAHPGLRSRIPWFFNFDMYTVQELLQIFSKFCEDYQYNPSEGAIESVAELLHKISSMPENMNARIIRQVFQHAVICHAKRYQTKPIIGLQELSSADIPSDITFIDGSVVL